VNAILDRLAFFRGDGDVVFMSTYTGLLLLRCKFMDSMNECNEISLE
jgi:hypothetical protein